MQALAPDHLLGRAGHAADDLGSEAAQPDRPQSEVLEMKRDFARWLCNVGIAVALAIIVVVIATNPEMH